MATHEDRNRCHHVMTFIKETLRPRNATPTGLQKNTVISTKLGDYTIPAGTEISIFQYNIMHDEKYWVKPFEFILERFLDSDGRLTNANKAFIPFGVGRRNCLGEKLAIADLFLVLVRILQKTTEYELVLHYDNKEDILTSSSRNAFLNHNKMLSNFIQTENRIK